MAVEKIINVKVVETGLDLLNTDLAATATAIKNVDKEADNLNAGLEKSEFKTFKQQLKEANAELQQMSSLFGETSTEAVNAAKNVAKIKDEMEFQKELVKSYNPDEKFRALTQTAGIATLALGGLKDGFSALGIESETLDKIIGSAQGLLGATSAISGLADAYGILTAKKKATATATSTLAGAELAEGAAGATGAVGVGALATAEALLLSPITLTVAAIALLVGGFVLFKDKIAALLPFVEGFTKFMKNAYDAVTDFIGLTSDQTRAFDKIAEAAKKSTEKNNKFLAEHGDEVNKYTKMKIDAVQRYNEEVQKKGADQVALQKRLDRELLAVDKLHQDDLKKSRDEAAKKKAEDQKEAHKKEIEAQKKHNEKLKELEAKRQKSIQDESDFKTAIAVAEVNQLKKIDEDKKTDQEKLDEELAAGFEKMNVIVDADLDKKEKDAAREKEADKKVLEFKKQNQETLLNIGSQAIGLFASLGEKNKKLQKAAIIAESALGIGRSIIATNASNVAAVAEGAALAIPTAGASVAAAAALVTSNYIALGVGTAANIAATAKALQALGGGSSPSAGDTGRGGTTNSAQGDLRATAPQFNLSQGTTAGAIALANQNKQEPIKAFVVGQDISNQQQLDLRIQQTASFG